MKMDPKLGGGNWGEHLDLVSLKPVSAFCAENSIDKARKTVKCMINSQGRVKA